MALWASVPYNAGAALLMALPGSALAQWLGFPGPVHPVYGALLAVFALLFGGAYAWLAAQPVIHRPLVGLAAAGKLSVFAVVAAFWLGGSVPGRLVLATSGDLVFGGVFLWWLLAPPK